jgi:hypothetical protein
MEALNDSRPAIPVTETEDYFFFFLPAFFFAAMINHLLSMRVRRALIS